MRHEEKIVAPHAWGKSFVRSFFVMSAMNSERMQNVGVAFALEPLTDDPERRVANLEFFNTNPYLAPAIVGATGRMLADGRSPEVVRTFKRETMGPFGAIGDSLFWCALKPLAAMVGILLAIVSGPKAAIAGILLVYNPPQLAMRVWGFFKGVRHGRWVVAKFTQIPFARICAILGAVSAALLGAAATLLIATGRPGLDESHPVVAGLVGAAAIIGVGAINEKYHRPETIFYLSATTAFLTFFLIG